MAAEFDLNLIPLYRVKGQEWPQLPGLLTMAPPKRTARGREEDHLLIYLTLSGNVPISSIEYKEIVGQVAQRFYKTSGSLTLALRSTVETLNQFLVNRNLHTTSKGQYVVGRLILGALRETKFVFTQCGPTHIFHLTQVEPPRQIHGAESAGRGLGVGQAAPAYFAQAELDAGDLLVLCPDLPDKWEASLQSERKTSLEALRRKLLGITSGDLNAVLMQPRPGKGLIHVLDGAAPAEVLSSDISEQGSQSVSAPTTPVAIPPEIERTQVSAPHRPTSRVDSERPAGRFVRSMAEAKPSSPPAEAAPAAAPAVPREQTVAERHVQRLRSASAEATPPPPAPSGRFVSPRTVNDIPEIKRPASRRRRDVFRGLARVIQGARGAMQKLSQGFGHLLPGPGGSGEVTGSSMAILAIAIPVIIVAIAGTVYLHYGRTMRYQQSYDMALDQAAQARGLTDPLEVRRAWESTIYYLDLAEQNQLTENSSNLRQESQTALDNLDGILRLDFRQAIIGGLSRTAQVVRMAASDTDLYLLDDSTGSLIRAFTSGQSYEVDTSFKCSPGQYDGVTVGDLVDVAALPMNNVYNARVLAMDAKGNLLYCGLSEPSAISLAPPQFGWQEVTAFSLDTNNSNLYVLDPSGKAVWYYEPSDEGKYTDLPIMFFGEQVPQSMDSAIDLATNNADLYLLFEDGHMASCPLTRYDVVPLRCADPATFEDTRPERQSGAKINDAIFTQMSFAAVPDPSLYLLEPLTRAVYRFSPRSDSLQMLGQFRASMEQSNTLFSGPATAMTISPSRYIFLSTANQVFFATDVP